MQEIETLTWTVHTKSCQDVTLDYPENTFKAIITSPPYKKKDGYSNELMTGMANKLYLVTKQKGLSFINFASLVESWGRPFDVYDIFIDAGWKPVTTIVWLKSMVFPGLQDLPGPLGSVVKDTIEFLDELNMSFAGEETPAYAKKSRKIRATMESLALLLSAHQVGHYTPIDDERRMNNLFEYIHVFSKGELPELDRFTPPLGVPYTDKSNLKRGTRGKRGDTHCAGNVWLIPYGTRKGPKDAHPHEYPIDLVKRCLTLAKAGPDDLVLDPFCGGGSTLIGAKEMGVSGVGYEISPDTAELAKKRIAGHTFT